MMWDLRDNDLAMSNHETRVAEVFAAALDLSPDERSTFLARECGGQPSLLTEVRSLLAADAQVAADGFMHASALDLQAQQFAHELQATRVGQFFGRYKLISLIGEGGMGEVYLAEDNEIGRRVAVKLVKSGMKSKILLRRFHTERQILANLQHPNIARLLDGGTTDDGLPYLVMEYVKGQPIDQYADEHKLSTTARLELFRTVCSALSYAHQHLVIHRDVKPSNILVTEDGTPKLLDFGIAKLLDSTRLEGSPDATATIMPAMTPEYASPEQVKGESVTTASDVYSLGVLLYESLTGHGPYRFKSSRPLDVANAVCEQQPERPSLALTRRRGDGETRGESNPKSEIRNPKSLRGDLDNILLTALRKESDRRYASVVEFSEDIRRHLAGLPVRARKNTFKYRASKFVSRNKIAVAASAVVATTLVGGLVATAWAGHLARSERARAEFQKEMAEQRFAEVRSLAHSVMFDYHDAIAPLSGSTKVREMLVRDSLTYLDRLSKTAGTDPALLSELAAAYLRVGDVQGRPYHPNLGQTDKALSSYQKALAILEPLAASDSAASGIKRDLATVHERIGNIQLRNGHWGEAQSENQQALSIREGLLALNPTSVEARREVADSYLYLGDAQQVICTDADCGRTALNSQRKALEIRQALAEASPSDSDLLRDVAQAFTRVGFRLSDIGSMTKDSEYVRQALASQQHSLSIREKLAAANSTSATDRRNLADQQMLYADAQFHSGDVVGSFVNYHRAREMFETLLTSDPYNAEAQRDMYNIYFKIARAWNQSGNKSAAKKTYRLAAEIAQHLLSSDPASEEDLQIMSAIYQKLSEISVTEGDLSEAIVNYRKVVEIDEKLVATMQTDYARFYAAGSYEALAGLYASYLRQTHLRPDQITENCRAALDWHQKFLDASPDLISKGMNLKPTPAMSSGEIARCEQAVSK
jgi:non-specific serine/threonine protein kinase/serine/threonine-protein kinase